MIDDLELLFATKDRNQFFAMHRALHRVCQLPQLPHKDLTDEKIQLITNLQNDEWRNQLWGSTRLILERILRGKQVPSAQSMLSAQWGPFPSITFGCFGAGKTYSLVHAIGQMMMNHRSFTQVRRGADLSTIVLA